MCSVEVSCWLFSWCENEPSHQQHTECTDVGSQMRKPQQLIGNGVARQRQQWLAQPPKGVACLYQQLWLSLYPALSGPFRGSSLFAKLVLGLYILIDGSIRLTAGD